MKPGTECRIQPQNIVAERSVLGSLMLENGKIDAVRAILKSENFYHDTHAKVYQAILALVDSGISADAVTVAGQLNAQGDFEDIGGVPYLLELLEAVPHAAHAVYYANLVIGCFRRREAIEIGRKLVESGFDMTKDDLESAESALAAATALATQLSTTMENKTRPLEVHVKKLIDNLESGMMPSYSDGIECVDKLIQGTADGELIVIAAATSNGKSLLGLQWLHATSSKQVPGLMISEEMAAISLASRSLSSITCIPSKEWLDKAHRLRFDAKEHFKTHAPILIAEKCGTVAAAEREIADAVKNHGVKIVAVDYAQMLRGEGFNKQERVADVSNRMKGCAMKHNIRLILLAQLNRDIDKRDDPTPQMSDIRDSAAIAMDADVVLMPFWPFKFDPEYPDPTEYRIYDRKNRNRGITDDCVKMRINCMRQRIEPWSTMIPADQEVQF